MHRRLVSILTIAGSDCSGGAGIQEDIRAAAFRNVFASTAITSVTVQNSKGISDTLVMNPEIVVKQIDSVFRDSVPRAIKIGLLGSLDNAVAISKFIRENAAGIPLVIDPVYKATSGGTFPEHTQALIEIYLNELFPLATIVTPNLDEAFQFHPEKKNPEETAIALLKKFKSKSVILKGGHSKSHIICDVLALNGAKDEIVIREVSASMIDCKNLHGTGCTFSSFLAAELAKGNDIESAFRVASWLMKGIIAQSALYSHGTSDYGPLNLFNYQTT